MARYTLITGEYHIFYPDLPHSGPEPDGDTVSYKPDQPALIQALPRQSRPPKFNGHGMTNIRFEAIDALETHFQGMHQELGLARQARDFMLAALGFEDVVFSPQQPNRIQSVANNPRRGYVLANEIETNGRTVAFVYPGNPTAADGAKVFLKSKQMEKSVNAALLKAGLAYAAFYTTLPIELISKLRTEAHQARASKLGIFAQESLNTHVSTDLPDLAALQAQVMWPKLFRRLANYFAAGAPDLSQFDAWLREDKTNRDDRLLLPNGELGNMHDFVKVASATKLALQYEPEDLVVLPDHA